MRVTTGAQAVQPKNSQKSVARCKLRHKMKLNFKNLSQALSASALFALGILALANLTPMQAWGQSAPATAIGEARKFPEKTKLGELTIGVFPEASLNGQVARFSASGRLINLTNMIVLPSSVYQQTLVVRYELDFQGNINRAWLLNPVELKIAQEEARRNP